MLLVLAPTANVQVSAGSTSQPAATGARSATSLLDAGVAAYDEGRFDAAADLLIEAIALAAVESATALEAEAQRRLALTRLEQARFPEADEALERAVSLFTTAGDRLGLARSLRHRSSVADSLGQPEDALTFARRAVAEAQHLDDPVERSRAVRRLLSFLHGRADYEATFSSALADARAAGDAFAEADLLHLRGDRAFIEGRFAEADADLSRARQLLETTGHERELAGVLTSLGRLQRAHGAAEAALAAFAAARAIQERRGDRAGAIQSINAMAVALQDLGRSDEALALYRQAVDLAHATGSPRIVNFQMGNLGGALLGRGDIDGAVPLLEESAARETNSYVRAIRYAQVTEARQRQGAHSEAVAAAAVAIEAMKNEQLDERLFGVLNLRATSYAALGLENAAIDDAREALRTLERVRSKLVPDDVLKRGFHERHQQLFDTIIELLGSRGRFEEALEASEQSRARAFLDLLASRVESNDETGVRRGAAPAPGGRDGGVGTSGTLSPRGAANSAGTVASGESGSFASPRAVAALDGDALRAQGRRLASTVLSYWVGSEHTTIWVVRPDRPVEGVRIEVSRDRLAELVQALWGGLDASPGAASARATTGVASTRFIPPRRAARELYALLVAPVESALPDEPGSRLTIVPHGPLLRLSFAALADGTDRYLLERFTLHYAPALSMFEVTGRLADSRGRLAPGYLLVGAPSTLPATDGLDLGALPGSVDELREIASDLPDSAVTILLGPDATEPAVRAAAAGRRVIHFATHGVIDDANPLESFLALEASDGDGRLTASEIYALDLDADLVVLSACRTALGTISADGIVGLSRAFFAAGTPSLVATLWDVADGPASRLMPEFYRAMASADKATALRTAQLRLLADLRAGRVRVGTPAGPVTLPERPVFWANFVLMGEP